MGRGRIVALSVAAAGLLVTAGYAMASAAVYDRLATLSGSCRDGLGTNDPTAFRPDGGEAVDTTPYLMPSPGSVSIPSRTPGIDLAAWWIPGRSADAPVVLVVHGLAACRRDVTVLLPAGMLHRAGFAVLLVDLRDHGESSDEDRRQAGGTDEYLDVLGAWDWLRARGHPASTIGLFGASMGAATVLIAGGEEHDVAAVWADSSYADIASIVGDELQREGYPRILVPGTMLAARLVGGDDLETRTPIGATAAYRGRPVFVTHGLSDDRIHPRYGGAIVERLVAASADVEAWFVPGAGHTKAMLTDTAGYERRLVTFFGSTLEGAR